MNNELMAPRKNKRSEASKAIAQAIIDQYKPTSAEEMQDALKDIFGPMFEPMLQGEMDSHLGYESNDRGYKDTNNRRNGYTHKTLKTTMGDVEIDAPRDRGGSFDPQLIPKRTKDVSGIEDKVLSMYAKGMSQRDIADTIEDIYGFEISHETISNITDQVIETANEWQNRPLKKFYSFIFVDCLYVNIRKEMETKNCAVYVVLGYDVSPAISGTKVYELINLLKEKQLSGVQITIVTWAPDSYGFGDASYWMQLHEEMRKAGFYIKTVEESCERFAVIDQEVVWYGNINLLAKDKVDDSIMRVLSKEIASELMEITFGDNG